LKRGCSDFVIGGGGLEIKKCSDISAHGREILPPPRERALERASMPEQSALLTGAKVLNTDATVRSKTTATTVFTHSGGEPIRARQTVVEALLRPNLVVFAFRECLLR